MKILKHIGLLTLALYYPLFADEVSQINPSIKELVTQVQQAPDTQKRVLMNQLKMRLKKMNSQSRKEAMRELKKSFVGKGKGMRHQRGQRRQHDSSLASTTHQPKFRHLRHGLRDGSGNGQGQGQGLGNGNQGNGHK